MSARARAILVCALLATSSVGVSACSFFAPSESRVRAGELFEAAHPKYDPYFRDVHAMQVEAASRGDQKRTARRPLVDALKLDPDAADVTLVQATHERTLGIAREAGTLRLDVSEGQGHVVVQNASKVDEDGRAFIGALEVTVHNEVERATALREVPAHVDALLRQGRALEPQVQDDLSRRGGRAAKQVMSELQASYDVLGELSKNARLAAREADDFVLDLRRAVGSDPAEWAARPSASAAASAASARAGKRPEPAARADRPKPAAASPIEAPKPKPAAPTSSPPPPTPAPAAKPSPPPPTKPADEFNP